MTANTPNYLTTGIQGPNLITMSGETTGLQFCVMYTGQPAYIHSGIGGQPVTPGNSGMRLARRLRTGHTWVKWDVTGAAATEMQLPNTDGDSHKWASLMVDGAGILHVWGNMHADPTNAVPPGALNYIKSTSSVLLNSAWPPDGVGGRPSMVATTLPGARTGNTYPLPCRLSDGRLVLFIRDGPTDVSGGPNASGSGRSNTSIWTLNATGSAWSARRLFFRGIGGGGTAETGVVGETFTFPGLPTRGPGTVPAIDGHYFPDDSSNFSAYTTMPFVDLQDRIHISWIWRQTPVTDVGRSINVMPGYAYSDDGGFTWKAANGTAITLPITPFDGNNPACRTGLLHPSGWSGSDGPHDQYLNWGGMCVDNNFHPVICVSQNPWLKLTWNGKPPAGTGWTQTSITADPVGTRSGGTQLGGYQMTGRMNCYWFRNALWILTNVATPYRHIVLLRADGTDAVWLGPQTIGPQLSTAGPGSAGAWEAHADPYAYLYSNSIEILLPDGDEPRVFEFGFGARAAIGSFIPPTTGFGLGPAGFGLTQFGVA